jgi:branched-chain amino acid transport system substrate-binding protein
MSGICSAFFMKEAMEWAAKNGGISGAKIKQGMYQKKDWVPAGLEGVCVPSTWTPDDHRGTTTVAIYRAKVSGATEASVDELVKAGTIKLEKVTSIDLPRKKEWLGW